MNTYQTYFLCSLCLQPAMLTPKHREHWPEEYHCHNHGCFSSPLPIRLTQSVEYVAKEVPQVKAG